ncbi:MAG: DUF4124 domain-containing protein [Rhodocyclaceae bacterium]|nr:DUF4124 domain-containing protein [Rhodocyclaceae bacterium]
MRAPRFTARSDLRALAACLAIFAGPAAAGEVYRWVDEQGKTHFSDTPPIQRKAEKIEIRPVMPSSPAAATQGRGWQQQIEESNLRRNQQEKQEKAAEHGKQQAEQKCLAARRSLDTLNRGRPLYRVDKNGERVYIEDDQRQIEISAARRTVDTECR